MVGLRRRFAASHMPENRTAFRNEENQGLVTLQTATNFFFHVKPSHSKLFIVVNMATITKCGWRMCTLREKMARSERRVA